MKYSKIRKYDVTNGPGVRTTLFVSGCTNNCEGCFNKELQNFNHGDVWTKEVEDEFIEHVNNINIKGVNILGGEPMEQTMDNCLLNLLKRINKETGKNIWLWSGYTFDQIISDEKKRRLLECVDVLIDGRFEINKRNISLKYRGSENQRVIDVKKSLKENKICLLEI
ncbi:MAG: anaerobic ribonucleoside-triphosphate reductase activating protein [Clostridium sp.]|nr:anaerobic ribonucleoside-triphosphate reductase activating protein [Clostridium sp.]